MKTKFIFESTKLPGAIISGTVYHDPGVHTYSNGDPGYPSDTNFEIESIKFNYVELINTMHEDLFSVFQKEVDKFMDEHINKYTND
jgi:hypothetical protein